MASIVGGRAGRCCVLLITHRHELVAAASARRLAAPVADGFAQWPRRPRQPGEAGGGLPVNGRGSGAPPQVPGGMGHTGLYLHDSGSPWLEARARVTGRFWKTVSEVGVWIPRAGLGHLARAGPSGECCRL